MSGILSAESEFNLLVKPKLELQIENAALKRALKAFIRHYADADAVTDQAQEATYTVAKAARELAKSLGADDYEIREAGLEL